MDGIGALLEGLEAAMTPALAAARSLALAPASTPQADSADRASLRPLIEELRGLLQRRSLRARRVLEALEAALGGEAARLAPLKDAIAALDYARAATLLDTLAGQPAVSEELQ